MLPDHVVGVLCLGGAVLAATLGTGPAERGQRPARRYETATIGREASAEPKAGTEGTTTTATAPEGDDAAGTTGTSSSTTAPASSTTTTTTTTTDAPPDPAADEAAAQRALLVAADLPPGYRESRPAPPPGSSEGPFERCLGSDAAALSTAVRARAASPEYVKEDTGTVSATAAVFDQPASAEKVMSVLGSDPARSCFENLINARLARNPKLSEDVRGRISPIDPGRFGDQTTAFRFEVRLPAEDVEADPPEGEQEIPFLADFVFVRRGRTLVLLEFGSLRNPFPGGEVRAVATSVAKHM